MGQHERRVRGSDDQAQVERSTMGGNAVVDNVRILTAGSSQKLPVEVTTILVRSLVLIKFCKQGLAKKCLNGNGMVRH